MSGDESPMESNHFKSSLVLGAFICAGLIGLGYVAGRSAIQFKEYERTVSVKGLAEREVPADVAVWPIRFVGASGELAPLYDVMEKNSSRIVAHLVSKGFETSEINVGSTAITDKLAQQYGGAGNVQLRYSASQTITVRSSKIDLVRTSMNSLVELGKTGIAFGGSEYQQEAEFIFTGLNTLKPAMVEEATQSARQVADKFARDSDSKLGKIKNANQGQFIVENLDSNTPYIKKVRVVSTIEYYLSD